MSTEPARSGQGPHLDPSRLSFWSDVDVNDRNDVEEFFAGVEADRNASPGFSADLPTSTELAAEYEHLRSCQLCGSRLGEVTSSLAFAVQRSDQAGLPGALPSSDDVNRRRDAISVALGAFEEEHVPTNALLDRQVKVSWWRRRSAAAGSGARGVGVGGPGGSLVFTPARVLAGAAALSLVTGVVLFQQRQGDSTANGPITDAAVATEVDAASGGNDSPLDSRSSEFDIADSAESVEAPNRAAATEAAANGAADSGAAATGALKAPSSGVQGESSVPASSSDDRAALEMVMPGDAPSAVSTNSPTTLRPPSTEAPPPTITTTRRAATTVPTTVPTSKAAKTPAARGPGDAGPVSAEPAFDALPSTITTRGSRTTARKTAKKATPTTKASATDAAAMPRTAAGSSATALPATDLGDLGSFADLAAGSDALRQLAVQRGLTSPVSAIEAAPALAPATTAAPASGPLSGPVSSTTTPTVAPAAGAIEAAPAAPAPVPPVCQVPGAYAVARLAVAGRPLLGFVTGPPQAPVIVVLDSQACTIVG